MAGTLKHRAWTSLKYWVEGPEQRAIDAWMQYLLPRLSTVERRMLFEAHDDRSPLPAGAENDLSAAHPRLLELRRNYARLKLPVNAHSQWEAHSLDARLNLLHFRGDNPYVWQYREWPRANTLKYYIYLQYLRSIDPARLLDRLLEDGAFGCLTYEYAGQCKVSRDQLDAANELLFLDRQLGLLDRKSLRVLDIGAGYGRLAYRMSQAAPGLSDYCCIDAIPDSSFLCEYYLRFRGVPTARVVTLDRREEALQPDRFDLVVNIHSFSECTYEAIAWWAGYLKRMRVPALLIVPNEPTELLSSETDGSKRDYRPLMEEAGYRLETCEPVIRDDAVRELLGIEDHFFLFRYSG